MNPTQQQLEIWNAFANPNPLMVRAGAGTGKTTTIVQGADKLPSSSNGFVAFTTTVVNMLRAKLPATCTAVTAHSLGRSALVKCLGSVDLSETKALDVLKEVWTAGGRIPVPIFSQWKSWIDLCKANLASTPEEVLDVLSAYEFSFPLEDRALCNLTLDALDCSIRWARMGVIDFSDMIWVPVTLGFVPHAYETLLVDECQDLSRCARALIAQSANRLICVGDPHQAIMGFAGADSDSYTRLLAELGSTVTELPLSVTWRCPSSHVALANKLVPELQARPNAPAGTIRNEPDFSALPGAMVICRFNAPLVSNALKLIRNGTPAVVRGRDISTGLIRILSSLHGNTRQELSESLAQKREEEEARIRESAHKNKYARLTALADRFDCMTAVIESSASRAEAKAKLDTLFSDTASARAVVFSSIHRAKGLESNDVYILQPEILPYKKAQDQTQEKNLIYVAITRSKSNLTFCGPTPAILCERPPIPAAAA